MNKQKDSKHISLWISNSLYKECNGYIHNKNNEEYVNTMIRDNLTGMMKKFERRTAKLLFKISVEVAKIFWLIIKHYNVDLRDAYTLHRSCVDEVKRINGAIQYPLIKDDKDDDDEWFFD